MSESNIPWTTSAAVVHGTRRRRPPHLKTLVQGETLIVIDMQERIAVRGTPISSIDSWECAAWSIGELLLDTETNSPEVDVLAYAVAEAETPEGEYRYTLRSPADISPWDIETKGDKVVSEMLDKAAEERGRALSEYLMREIPNLTSVTDKRLGFNKVEGEWDGYPFTLSYLSNNGSPSLNLFIWRVGAKIGTRTPLVDTIWEASFPYYAEEPPQLDEEGIAAVLLYLSKHLMRAEHSYRFCTQLNPYESFSIISRSVSEARVKACQKTGCPPEEIISLPDDGMDEPHRLPSFMHFHAEESGLAEHHGLFALVVS